MPACWRPKSRGKSEGLTLAQSSAFPCVKPQALIRIACLSVDVMRHINGGRGDQMATNRMIVSILKARRSSIAVFDIKSRSNTMEPVKRFVR
jgi:hypothetical protein